MIQIGVFNELRIVRETENGIYLEDEYGEEVLLPNKFVPESFNVGEILNVFVFLDHEDRKTATINPPKVELGKFALLRVAATTDYGAFMDWGLDKELLVPFKEQRAKMEEGRSYIVRLEYDEESDRLFGSNRIERLLNNAELSVQEGDEVELLILKKTDLGYTAIVNHQHKGLIFENEIFGELKVGDVRKGYIKQIREENKMDLSLRPIGYQHSIDPDTDKVLEAINAGGGRLPLTDKSSPDDIYHALGMSKKAFKRAVGNLYKKKLILIGEGALTLVKS